MSMLVRGLALPLVLCAFANLVAQQRITAAGAKHHLGEKTRICGRVAGSIHLAQDARGAPTFLNLDEAYPNQIFTIVIWGMTDPSSATLKGS